MLDNTFTKISEILFAYIQEEVYVCREYSVNTNHHSIFMEIVPTAVDILLSNNIIIVNIILVMHLMVPELNVVMLSLILLLWFIVGHMLVLLL